jgi:predicted esterase
MPKGAAAKPVQLPTPQSATLANGLTLLLDERRGLPVFVAHGRQDRTLSFEIADRLRQKLEAAGLQVTWFPFDGGHDMPASVVVALNDFLTRLHPGP